MGEGSVSMRLWIQSKHGSRESLLTPSAQTWTTDMHTPINTTRRRLPLAIMSTYAHETPQKFIR